MTRVAMIITGRVSGCWRVCREGLTHDVCRYIYTRNVELVGEVDGPAVFLEDESAVISPATSLELRVCLLYIVVVRHP